MSSKAKTVMEYVILQCDIQPVYQPIFDLRDNCILGYEALARTIQGYSPETLFYTAKQINKVTEVDLACIEQAVALAPQEGNLFLNMQPSTAVWLTQNKERLTTFENIVPKDRAVLEIIESEHIKSIQKTLEALLQLKDQGFIIAIDDVTSGYNRLQLVASLQPSYIKLDGPVIRDCHQSHSQRMTIEHLNNMGQEMGFKVIAENIETSAELETIIKAGVSFGQGYYLGRPSYLFQNTYQKEGA